MFGNSREITTNQQGIHPDLEKIVQKHLQTIFARPISNPVQESFSKLDDKVARINKPIILDSGCGVGESTLHLCAQYPDHLVIGVDKSGHRLHKIDSKKSDLPGNVIFYQANLVDFWRQVHSAQWNIEKHFILYPNPWPLKKDLQKRFHAHPVFPVLLLLCKNMELRSNWPIYLIEFAQACRIVTGKIFLVEEFHPKQVVTPFERKYLASGQKLYRLLVDAG